MNHHLAPSWYYVAPSKQVRRQYRNTSVVAGAVLSLARSVGAREAVIAHLADRPIAVAETAYGIFAWLGGGEPSFAPPDDDAGWSADMRWTHVDVRTDPLRVHQDLADLPHFVAVHGYADPRVVAPLRVDGPRLATCIDFRWDTGVRGVYIPARLSAEVTGAGFQRTDITTLAGLMLSRHLVMPTPRLAGVARVHLGLSVRPGRSFFALDPAIRRLMHLGTALAFRRDVRRDAAHWASRSDHRTSPSASLETFARWASQFAPQEVRRSA